MYRYRDLAARRSAGIGKRIAAVSRNKRKKKERQFWNNISFCNDLLLSIMLDLKSKEIVNVIRDTCSIYNSEK